MPILVEGLAADLAVATDGPRRVWALDPTGRRAKDVPATHADGVLRFSPTPEYRTAW